MPIIKLPSMTRDFTFVTAHIQGWSSIRQNPTGHKEYGFTLYVGSEEFYICSENKTAMINTISRLNELFDFE